VALRSYSCSGTPSDCVVLAMLGAIGMTPDIVVSGINRGPNLGTDIVYSGTCAAASEAVLSGIPGIAVSCASRDQELRYGGAASFVLRNLSTLVDACSGGVFINVNAPSSDDGGLLAEWCQPCRRLVGEYETRCHWHGGASPNALAKVAERRSLARARRLVDLLNVGPCEDPVAALLDLAGDAVALKDVLRPVVANLSEVAYRGGVGGGLEQVRGELSAYMQSMAMAERVLSRIVALDLEAKRVHIEDRRVDVMTGALLATLAHPDIGLDPPRQARARELLRAELKARNH